MTTSELKIKNKIEVSNTIKITPFKKGIRKTLPHKHNKYFEIVFLSKGTGFHSIDGQNFPINSPVVFLIRKEQVHYWEISSEPEGFVIIIKKNFVEESFDKQLKQLFSQVSAFSTLYLQEKNTIQKLFELLSNEYQQDQLQKTVLFEGLLKALLVKLLENTQTNTNLKPLNKNVLIEFRELILLHINTSHKIAFYANLLHTTPQNLNAICRKESQQSASKIISEQLIIEAKRLLLYSDINITQIAYTLGFKDNSHFTKYFKRFTKTTPKNFRNSL